MNNFVLENFWYVEMRQIIKCTKNAQMGLYLGANAINLIFQHLFIQYLKTNSSDLSNLLEEIRISDCSIWFDIPFFVQLIKCF